MLITHQWYQYTEKLETACCACQLFWEFFGVFSDSVTAMKLKAPIHIRLTKLHVSVLVLFVWEVKGPSFSGFSALGTVVCENGDLFQFIGDFWDTVIATKLKAHVHVHLIKPYVLVYILLVCDLWGLSFNVAFVLLVLGPVPVYWGFLRVRSNEGHQISHRWPIHWDACFDVWVGHMRPTSGYFIVFFGAPIVRIGAFLNFGGIFRHPRWDAGFVADVHALWAARIA